MDFGDDTKYYLDIPPSDSLNYGNYRDGVDTLLLEGTVSRMTRVVSVQVFGRIYNFLKGKAKFWLGGQVNEDRSKFVGLHWFKLNSTAETRTYVHFNAKRR